MDAVLLALAAAAGAGALWWHQSRPHRVRGQLSSAMEPDTEVVFHVAGHEARTRGQPITALHLLYGLLQDEAITEAIRAEGKDPDALEDRVLAELDKIPRGEDGYTEEVAYVYARASHSAGGGDRKLASRDVWAYIAGSGAAAAFADSGISHVAILHRLCHGCGELAVDDTLTGDVHVVLRNDDYTTREFVCEILRQVFTFNEADAETRMMQTHTEGRGVIGRFSVAEAHTKIQEVRDRAKRHGFPLWIAIEPI